MEPEQALENLDTAVAVLTLSRAQHLILVRSVAVLKATIEHWRLLMKEGSTVTEAEEALPRES
jgi:hypothetical protein